MKLVLPPRRVESVQSFCILGRCKAWIIRARVSFSILAIFYSVASGQSLVPPPEPSVKPLIGATYPSDANGDRIDDRLFAEEQTALSAQTAARTAAQKTVAQARLNAMVDVELIFKQQITQKQIDTFQARGGKITYIYRAVSYGWNGQIPLGKATEIPKALGDKLLLITEARKAVLHMDTATRTGRVRPIWATGFAGNVAGFDGDSNTTIAICDTGTDESHTDLNGRRVYWSDFSTDAAASPIDVVQHGSHVMGIATGTGAAGGSGAGTLSFTQEGSLSTVAVGNFPSCFFELPASSVNITFVATWVGGGSTTLYLVSHPRGVKANGSSVGVVSVSGSSPLTLTTTQTGSLANEYSPGLISTGTIADFVVKCQVTNYPAVGDGFNKMRGVAPGCNWATAKVFTNSGSGLLTWTSAAIDDLVANRVAKNIKVMNLSLGALGSPGLDTTTRQKINTAVNNGIVATISAGNDGGAEEVDDPGRAAMAITVAAANDVDQLTDYTSEGFASPGSTAGQEEDYKPDLMAPGGSGNYYSALMSVDSNSGDGTAFADQQANDYYNIQGTSMSAPFTAGCAALVIDALQQSGVTWDFASSQSSRYVKMILCATSTESNTTREGNTNNPTLQRATAGPNSFPVGKDQFEGYGMINPDAAVEAVSQAYTLGASASNTLGPTVTDRRAWARKMTLVGGVAFIPNLTVPAGSDYDLYLYSATPSAYGTPTLLASSTSSTTGASETFTYTPGSATNAVLVVKRVSGSGSFTLTSLAPPVLASIEGANLAYTENQTATAITSALAVSDPDSTNLTGATVSITSGFASGQDTLAMSPNPQNGITASYVAGTGVLTLGGTASLANYQAALRAVTYINSSNNPSTTNRTVTFSATDGTYTASTTRNIAITSVNDAPTLNAISDPAAIAYGSPQQTVNLGGISDGGIEGQSLTVTASSNNTGLIPNPAVTYTSPNTTGSLAYTPVSNASGSATITVTVQDNGGTANGGFDTTTRTFLVTVNPPLSSWRTLQGLASDGSSDQGNPRGDGVTNLMKYALNLAPNAGDLNTPKASVLSNATGTTVAELTGLPAFSLDGSGHATLTFIRRRAVTNPGIVYSVEFTSDMTGFAVNPSATSSTLTLDANWERVTVTDSLTPGKRFARLKVATFP